MCLINNFSLPTQSSIAHFVWSVVRYNEVLCLVKKIDRAH